MKTNMKKLIQQVTEEVKNKRTQKIMVWSLVAAVGFLVLIGIFSALSGKDEDKAKQEETSTQTQEEENQNTHTGLSSERFYVDFSKESTTIHLATINGTIDDKEVEVHISYNKDDTDIFMYYYSEQAQLADVILNYSLALEEGVAYELSVEENNGVIRVEQDGMTLCLVSVTPKGTCKWTSIVPDLSEYGDISSSEEDGTVDTTEDVTDEVETTESIEQSTPEQSTPEESISEEGTVEESQSKPTITDDGKVNYKALFGDIVISAFMALIFAAVVLLIIIAITKKANPLSVVMVTVSDMYPNLKERFSLKRRPEMEEEYEEDDYEDDDYEDDDYEDDDYEEDDYEDDSYEDEE